MKIKEFETFLNQKQGELLTYKNTYNDLKKKLNLISKNVIRTEQAQVIIQQVAKLTQEQIIFHIEDIVNSAIDAVFPGEYEFKIKFVNRRNKTECDIVLMKDENKLNPMLDNGGGVVDIVSFSLRIALWNLKNGKKMYTVILDEPFKNLSKSLRPKACIILQELSKKLNLQFIIITHDQDIIDIADKSFLVKKYKNISKVEEL